MNTPTNPERLPYVDGRWICVPDCGNEPSRDGFTACDPQGRSVAAVPVAWDGTSSLCRRCGRIFDRSTGFVTGQRAYNVHTEFSTCENCGGYVELRGGVWQHVTPDTITLACPGTHHRAKAVDTKSAASLLGAIVVNLTVYGTGTIFLYRNGFLLTGPDDSTLLWVGGEWTPDVVAKALRVPVDAITDSRDQQ